MNNKFLTLQTIFGLTKNDAQPTTVSISPGEIILRMNFPWDEIVQHLRELDAGGFIKMKQLSIASIRITDKGIDYINSSYPLTAA